MLIDTHSHLNMMVKSEFDAALTPAQLDAALIIATEASDCDVTKLINVATSLVESNNCILLAQKITNVWATVGLHPNDCTDSWQKDFAEITLLVKNKEKNKIVGIGECGIDRHYPNYNFSRQRDAFKAHIDLALEHDLALVVHSRDAYDETLTILSEYKHDIRKGIIHCFSYDTAFAKEAIAMNCCIGIGGTITYPKNSLLRTVVEDVGLTHIVLETDAPFLPPQEIRGKKNHPKQIKTIANFIATLLNRTFKEVATTTTANANRIFF